MTTVTAAYTKNLTVPMSRTDTVQWRAFACATVPLSREFAD